MIDSEDIIGVYANSLFQISKEENLEKLFFDNIEFLDKIFRENLDIIKILEIPTINKKEKKEIIDKIFKEKLNLYVINFIKLLIDNNRVSLLLKITNKYKEKYYSDNNIIEITIISAFDLNNFEKEEIEERCKSLFHKEIISNYVIDKNIIGGFIIKTNNMLYDMSVKTKLENIKKNILN